MVLEYLSKCLLGCLSGGKRGLKGVLDKGLYELLDKGICIRPAISIISRLNRGSK